MCVGKGTTHMYMTIAHTCQTRSMTNTPQTQHTLGGPSGDGVGAVGRDPVAGADDGVLEATAKGRPPIPSIARCCAVNVRVLYVFAREFACWGVSRRTACVERING